MITDSTILPYITGHEPAWPMDNCFLLSGFSYGPVDAQIRASMDAGLGKQRPKFTFAPWQLSGSIVVTLAEKGRLDHFIKDVIDNGAKLFLMADPFEPKRWLWRFQSPLTYTPVGSGHWKTTITIDRIPDNSIDLPHGFGLVDAAGRHLTDDHTAWLGG